MIRNFIKYRISRTQLLRCPLLLGCCLLMACSPRSYVTLLENTDGSVGKVLVSGEKGSSIIDKPSFGAALDGSSKEPFSVSGERIDQDFKQALDAQPVLPKRFLLYFETGGAQLTAESQQLLPQVLDEILRHPAVDISVIGHTDTAGDAEKNQELGLTRAQSVADLLISKQVQVLELTVSSHGESNLLAPTPDNTPEPLNRLVEISVR